MATNNQDFRNGANMTSYGPAMRKRVFGHMQTAKASV